MALKLKIISLGLQMYSMNTTWQKVSKIACMNPAFDLFLKTNWVLIWLEMGYWLLLEQLQERQICPFSFWCYLMSIILIYKRNIKVWKSSLALITCRNRGVEGFWDVWALDDTRGLVSITAWGGTVLVAVLSRLFAPWFGIMCWRFSRILWLGALQSSVRWKRCLGLD